MKIIKEFEWHHLSLIIDETEYSNTLVKQSLTAIFKDDNIGSGYEIFLDVQSFTQTDHKISSYKKYLVQASRSARGKKNHLS